MSKKTNPYWMFAALGMDLVALEVTMLYLGKWFDEKYDWKGMGIAGGAFLGLLVWVQHISWAIKRLEKAEKDGSSES